MNRWSPIRAGLYYLNPFAVNRCVLWSPFPPDECHDRLQQAVYPMSYWITFYLSLLSNPPEFQIYGWVKPTTFSIRDYRRFYLYNAWKRLDSTVANGRFVPVAGGTRIDLSVGMSRAMKVFVLLWVLIVSLALVGGFAQGGVMLVLMSSFALFFLGTIAYGRRRARIRQEILLQFLAQVLDATPTCSRPMPASPMSTMKTGLESKSQSEHEGS